jgi:ABC-type sugar transport system ATPase subunit
MTQDAIEIRHVTKTFPGVAALSDVSFTVRKGEVHAVVGENGAGKSTLMKILGGVYRPDRGELLVEGRPAALRSVQDSIAHGISVVYQEFTLMPELTVAENVFVADLPTVPGLPILRRGALQARAAALLERLALDLDPRALVKDLSVSQRQMVEIAKALHLDASILIMDEPTAALADAEVERLYEIIRTLKAQGRTILYISHRLKEIFDVADRVTVLRDGRYVGTEPVATLTQDRVVRMMVGRDVRRQSARAADADAEEALAVQGLTRRGTFQDVTFSVRKGEILGIAGLMGSGREELVKALYGLVTPDSGEVRVDGRPVRIASPDDAIRLGIGFVTEDRKDAGIFPLMSVRENVTLSVLRRIARFGGLHVEERRERGLLEEYTRFLTMRYASPGQPVMSLSGGNQQKVVLARALATRCRILLLLEPTRGIDVGAKAEIYQLLGELSRQGLALVVVSSDLPELMGVCSRILVVWQGRVTGDLSAGQIDEAAIMRCATGTAGAAGVGG